MAEKSPAHPGGISEGIILFDCKVDKTSLVLWNLATSIGRSLGPGRRLDTSIWVIQLLGTQLPEG